MTPPVVHLCRGREWRGGERQVALLAGELHRRGLRQLVVTGRDTALAAALARQRVPVATVPWRAALDPRACLGLMRVLAAFRDPRPVLHAHDSHALVLAGLATRLSPRPLIATRRSATVPGRLGWWQHADRVVAISNAVCSLLLEGGVPAGRIVIIPSAVDLDRLRLRPPPRWCPPGHGDVPFIVAVAALTPEKGHRVLLEAHAQLAPRPLLVLAGDGPERASLGALTRARGTDRDVLFAGAVDDATPLIHAARALVQPSLREALGTAVLEALALGTPVIASDTGGLSEVLEAGSGALVPPNDPAALAAAIACVLQAPGRRAVPPHLSRFALGTVADQLTQMYTSASTETER